MTCMHGSMTMSLLNHEHPLLPSSLLVLTLLHLFLPSSCVQKLPLSSPQGMATVDKVRLGSTPPNCRNRCNQCNPCAAVQVPTLPARPGPTVQGAERYQQQLGHGQYYSNYKPLGWKCRCDDRLYNP